VPRTKKPAGTAVDRRNGRAAVVPAGGLGELVEPDRPVNLCSEARRQWRAFWDSPVARAQTPADRGVVMRWIDAVDRYYRTMGEADRKPTVKGSTGQMTVNPLYKIAADARSTMEQCERQLGIGALNRAGLGIAVLSEQRSLADMNARYEGDGSGDEEQQQGSERDPRLEVVEGELA
jgi:P27 family predicted phage terminase small subunit